jgi:hypothetical protein
MTSVTGLTEKHKVRTTIWPKENSASTRLKTKNNRNIQRSLAPSLSLRSFMEDHKDILDFSVMAEKNRYYFVCSVVSFIKEHYTRKIDFFFHHLSGVIGQESTFKLTGAPYQYGRGTNDYQTIACHSAIVPGFIQKNKDNKEHFANRYFVKVLNSTVELPKEVNEIDRVLEEFDKQKYDEETEKTLSIREYCIKLLERVSFAKLTPHAAMDQLFEAYRIRFTLIQTNQQQQLSTLFKQFKQLISLLEADINLFSVKSERLRLKYKEKRELLESIKEAIESCDKASPLMSLKNLHLKLCDMNLDKDIKSIAALEKLSQSFWALRTTIKIVFIAKRSIFSLCQDRNLSTSYLEMMLKIPKDLATKDFDKKCLKASYQLGQQIFQ